MAIVEQFSSKIKKIQKRDGSLVDFDRNKITEAIFKAAESVGGKDRQTAVGLTNVIVRELEYRYGSTKIPNVEEIQDLVEKILIETGHAKTAKAYILYRYKKQELRQQQSKILEGMDISDEDKKLSLSENALRVLKERYLKKDAEGNIIETPSKMFKRVADNVASADLIYDKDCDVKKTENDFYEIMSELEFLPNSPTLMNAGNHLQQLSACFVLPIEDSMEQIFESVRNTALIHKSGGGTGFSFSRLRPKNDLVKSTKGVSSGPISFMKVFDAATNVVKQGGKRRGANMGVLRIDHPDILDFITCKENNAELNNFNISVGLTEEFMKAVERNDDYDLINPRSKQIVNRISARMVFDMIVTSAWRNGEPGILFLDRINRDNPTPQIGEIEATNPCGEQPLLAYEACNLGSINLSKFVADGKIDYQRLKHVIHIAIHFLDNVIDKSHFPLQKITDMVKANRKVGLGVMGFADMLIQLKIPYNSQFALDIAEDVMKFVNSEAKKASEDLAVTRGAFPNFKGSVYDVHGAKPIRNATRTTIAPTGTLSMIADCSSGIEPYFALSYVKRVMNDDELVYGNKYLEMELNERGIYSERLIQKIAKIGSLQKIPEVPEDMKKYYVVSYDITPYYHISMQASFQKYTDNAVSKTVNFPYTAGIRDVEEVFLLAYRLNCKGVTIYRDGSRDKQVFEVKKDISDSEIKSLIESHVSLEKAPTHQEKEIVKIEVPKKDIEIMGAVGKKVTLSNNNAVFKNKVINDQKDICPDCGEKLNMSEGCALCVSCGFSFCHN